MGKERKHCTRPTIIPSIPGFASSSTTRTQSLRSCRCCHEGVEASCNLDIYSSQLSQRKLQALPLAQLHWPSLASDQRSQLSQTGHYPISLPGFKLATEQDPHSRNQDYLYASFSFLLHVFGCARLSGSNPFLWLSLYRQWRR